MPNPPAAGAWCAVCGFKWVINRSVSILSNSLSFCLAAFQRSLFVKAASVKRSVALLDANKVSMGSGK
jgi:hypothetical protein